MPQATIPGHAPQAKIVSIRHREEIEALAKTAAVQAEVDELTERFNNSDLASFVGHLLTARRLWRQYRDLVERPDLPEALRGACIAEHGETPEERDAGVDYGTPYLTPELIQRNREMAEEAVAQRIRESTR